MRVHELKTIQPFYGEVASEDKPFEVRENDRDFRCGDFLKLMEWDGTRFTGAFVVRRVTYVLRGFRGVKEGWVVMGLEPSWLP